MRRGLRSCDRPLMSRSRLAVAVLLSATVWAGTAFASSIHVTHTVDPDAPATALPKQTFRVTGLITGARYRLGWHLRGARRAGCTQYGSSIVIKAYKRRVDFLKLPDGGYTAGYYKGFCAGSTYTAKVIRVFPTKGVTVKTFTITGAPVGPGPRPTQSPTAPAGDDSNAMVTFTDDPGAPSGSVPNKIAHLTGLTPGASYYLHVVNRTPGTDCFNEGTPAGQSAGAEGRYDAPVPSPFYGQGLDLCPGATYDVELRRSRSQTDQVTLQTTSFTAGSPR